MTEQEIGVIGATYDEEQVAITGCTHSDYSEAAKVIRELLNEIKRLKRESYDK